MRVECVLLQDFLQLCWSSIGRLDPGAFHCLKRRDKVYQRSGSWFVASGHSSNGIRCLDSQPRNLDSSELCYAVLSTRSFVMLSHALLHGFCLDSVSSLSFEFLGLSGSTWPMTMLLTCEASGSHGPPIRLVDPYSRRSLWSCWMTPCI